MEVKILKQDKNLLEIELDNLTIAEFLRNELWQDKATELAVWKRDHPSKNPVLILKTNGKSAKKVLEDTIERLRERNDNLLKEFKKIK
ncbi:MAG: RpoL/Rpb11 RNA polymerase subunit family protein [Candidatus Pacearchaeota archaeon]